MKHEGFIRLAAGPSDGTRSLNGDEDLINDHGSGFGDSEEDDQDDEKKKKQKQKKKKNNDNSHRSKDIEKVAKMLGHRLYKALRNCTKAFVIPEEVVLFLQRSLWQILNDAATSAHPTKDQRLVLEVMTGSSESRRLFDPLLSPAADGDGGDGGIIGIGTALQRDELEAEA